MPYPRLSPVLNNCAMHSLTPEICAEVLRYAEAPDYNNQHNPEYLRLKDIFAEFYGYERDTFTWRAFSDTLHFYNAFDVQLVLGPVLRLFMKGSMVADSVTPDSIMPALAGMAEPPLSVEEYINGYSEISDRLNGRYRPIAPDELAQYVGKPLGLSIRYHPQEGEIRESPAEHQIAQVNIHHLGDIEGTSSGHWERVPDTASEDCIDYQSHDDTKLTCILPLLGNDQIVSQFGIKLLRDHVALVTSELAEPRTIQLTSAQIAKYISSINFVLQALAIKLLGDPITDDTQNFIAAYPVSVWIPPMQIVENYIRTPVGHKPQVSEGEMQVIRQLLSGLSTQQITALVDLKFFASLGQAARVRVNRASTYIQTMPVNFGAPDDIDAYAAGLIADVTARFNSPEEDLRILGRSKASYAQLQAAFDIKVSEIQQAALRRKREDLLIEIGFNDYVVQFNGQATEMEEAIDREQAIAREEDAAEDMEESAEDDDPDLVAAGAARTFVDDLTRAKERFLQGTDTPIEESKRELKAACEAAVAAARPSLRDHRSMIATMVKFLIDVVSLLSLLVTENRWTMFYATPAETLDNFEADVINNPGLLARGG